MSKRSASEPTLICLTPVRNESWILDRFLLCASTWADHIIVADQHSDDGSRAIARAHEKVKLIDNDHPGYDEQARQKLLIEAARRLPVDGKRILIALDADEMLSANWADSSEWRQLLETSEGTVLHFRWANLLPGIQRSWRSELKPFGFVDDGSPHEGTTIHSPRIPTPEAAPTLHFEDIRVLHYQYTNWPRMKSKQRWYQCWERLNHPSKRPVTLYRQYHRMDAARERATPIRPEWIAGYEKEGIDMHTIEEKDYYHWDEKLVQLFLEHGVGSFRKLDVWNQDWTTIAESMELSTNGRLQDPRSPFDRAVHWWLARTQPHDNNLAVRVVQQLLRLVGW